MTETHEPMTPNLIAYLTELAMEKLQDAFPEDGFMQVADNRFAWKTPADKEVVLITIDPARFEVGS